MARDIRPASPPLRPWRAALRRWWRVPLAALAWAVFVYWWLDVLRPAMTTKLVMELTVFQVACFAVAIVFLTAGWVLHNLRIARRGRRGKVAWYTPPVFEHDRLGRRLLLPERERLLGAAEVSVHVENDWKVYAIE